MGDPAVKTENPAAPPALDQGLEKGAARLTKEKIENVINQQTPSAVRATILSLDSLLFRLLTAMLAPGVGLVADSYGLPTAFTLMALIYGMLMLGLLLFWNRQRNRAGIVAA